MASHVFESAAHFEPEHARTLVLCCSDGRFREAVDDFLHEHLGLTRYDRLVMPGGPGAIAGGAGLWRQEEGVLEDIRFLMQAHQTDVVNATQAVADPTADSFSRMAVKYQRIRPYWFSVKYQDDYTRQGEIEVGADGRLEVIKAADSIK